METSQAPSKLPPNVWVALKPLLAKLAAQHPDKNIVVSDKTLGEVCGMQRGARETLVQEVTITQGKK